MTMPTEEQTYRVMVVEKLESIESQTKRTNGRVTKLEKQVLIGLTAITIIILLKMPELLPLLHLAM